jgi:thymidylate synthase (FAD)
MRVELVTKTQGVGKMEGLNVDELVAYQARVSSPKNHEDKLNGIAGLIRYCALHSHWSVFDTVNLGFEIETSRAIGRQLIRHSSIHPQEHSQRYEAVTSYELLELRGGHDNNRQSSSEHHDPQIGMELASSLIEYHLEDTNRLYKKLVDNGVARECARGILPETATSKLYMNGTLRSWITFLNVRLHETAQLEAREIAQGIRDVILEECPVISEAFLNFHNAEKVHFLDQLVLNKYH